MAGQTHIRTVIGLRIHITVCSSCGTCRSGSVIALCLGLTLATLGRLALLLLGLSLVALTSFILGESNGEGCQDGDESQGQLHICEN